MKPKHRVVGVFPPLTVGGRLFSFDLENDVFEKAGVEFILKQAASEEDVINVVKSSQNIDGLLTTSCSVSRKVMQHLENCKLIGVYGIGVDHVDLRAASERGIYVINARDYCISEVAEHALSLILACGRKLFLAARLVKKGEWEATSGLRPILPLNSQTVGLVGFGKIARNLALKLRPLGVKIITYDPYIDKNIVERWKIEKVDFLTLLSRADYISIHIPLTQAAEYMFGENEFKAMKKTAYIINTARGKIINESALRKALERRWIAGAGLDVLEEEPPNIDNALFQMDNVIITPHIGCYSEGSQEKLHRSLTEDVIRILQGKKPVSFVRSEMFKYEDPKLQND
jgi:D-3-phosphoglycerate dehydrogenase